MRLSKGWMIAGAALGLLISIGIQTYSMLLLGRIASLVVFLFWPFGFLAGFYFPTAPLVLPAILGNAVLFGTVAAIFRSRLLLLLVALVVVAWWATPPSDRRLTKRFSQSRSVLQHVVDTANWDSGIVRITATQVEAADGKIYEINDASTVLTNARWREYREQLLTLNMTEIAFGHEKSGEVFVFARTPKLGMFRSSYGYLYCPGIWDRTIYFVACSQFNDSQDSHAYRYQRLDRNWYIYETFEPQQIE